jgi:hypothetical protein
VLSTNLLCGHQRCDKLYCIVYSVAELEISGPHLPNMGCNSHVCFMYHDEGDRKTATYHTFYLPYAHGSGLGQIELDSDIRLPDRFGFTRPRFRVNPRLQYSTVMSSADKIYGEKSTVCHFFPFKI